MAIAATLLEQCDPHSGSGLEWESLVSANEASGFMQSLHWSTFKRRQGLDCLHVAVHDEAKLIGGGIFYAAVNAKGAGILVCPEGPVLPWSDDDLSEKVFRLLLKTVSDNAQRMQAMAVRLEPRLESAPPWLLRGFGRAPFDLVPQETLYLDLTKSESELLDCMQPKGRYNIRLAERHGVCVHEESFLAGALADDTHADDARGDDTRSRVARSPVARSPEASVSKLHSVLSQASRRNGFALEPLSFFLDLAETLGPVGLATLFFAEHEGETLGALLLLTYGQRATYLYGGIGNTKRELMAGYALQWAAMLKAKSAGCTTYDMYGYDQFQAPQNQYAQFSRFKSQFGGQVKRFVGAHDYFFVDRLADVVIKALGEIEEAQITPTI